MGKGTKFRHWPESPSFISDLLRKRKNNDPYIYYVYCWFLLSFHFFLKKESPITTVVNLRLRIFLSGNAFLQICLFSLQLSQQIVLHLILEMIIAHVGDYCMQTKPVNQTYDMILLWSNITNVRGQWVLQYINTIQVLDSELWIKLGRILCYLFHSRILGYFPSFRKVCY